MKVYNLKTNLLDSNNVLNEQKLQELLTQNINKFEPVSLNNKTRNSTANNIYDIKINGNKYFLKTLLYNQLIEPEKELDNMTKINSNRVIKPYILQCKYLVKTNDTIISIFENVNSMVLLDFINKIQSLTDIEKKNKIKRYLIIGLLKAVADLHKVNVCHLQLNVNNILINMNNKYNNNEVYSTENPIKIKLINFNLNFNNKKKKYINIQKLDKLDPYFNYSVEKIISLLEGKKYDTWCVGLIIFRIVLEPTQYFKFIDLLIKNKIIKKTEISYDNEFDEICENILQYSLSPLNKREESDFILNMIVLDEKHN